MCSELSLRDHLMTSNRNDPCPCGSGKKFKKCCMQNITSIDKTDLKVEEVNKSYLHIRKEIEYIISKANEGKQIIVLIPPLVFFSTDSGDAWMLDVDDSLALRLLNNFENCQYTVLESNSKYSIEWKGSFEIDINIFRYFSKEGKVIDFYEYPCREIIRQIEMFHKKT